MDAGTFFFVGCAAATIFMAIDGHKFRRQMRKIEDDTLRLLDEAIAQRDGALARLAEISKLVEARTNGK